jgi:hypothetical protein
MRADPAVVRELLLRRVAPRLDSDRGLWFTVASMCAAMYALTAHWTFPGLDTEAAAWPAWSLAHRGSLNLVGIANLPTNAWFVHAHGQLLSNRTIGVELAGVPVNALLGWTGISAAAAAALTAVLMSSAAIANVAVVLRSMVPLPFAIASSAVVGFGTAMWTVSSAELWTHTADALWLSLVLLALNRQRHLLAGLAFAPAILTRPHLALAGVVIALWLAIRGRSLRPILHIAVPVVAAMAGLVAINHAIWNHWSLTGGYGLAGYSVSSTASVSPAQSTGVLLNLGRTLAGAFFSPRCGLFLYTPVVLIGVAGLWRGFGRAPEWAQATALGGGVYEVAQSKINTFTGGTLFFSNRLILECLLLSAPLLVHSTYTWMAGRRWRATTVAVLATASVVIHAIGSFVPVPSGGGADIRPWDYWFLLYTIQRAGYAGWLTATIACLSGVTVLYAYFTRAKASSVDDPGPPRLVGSLAAEPLHLA